MYPFMDSWNVFARLGAYVGNTKLSANGTILDSSSTVLFNGSGSQSKTTTEFLWGVGAGYTWGKQLTFRVEYDGIPNVGDKNTTGQVNVGRLVVGALYRF